MPITLRLAHLDKRMSLIAMQCRASLENADDRDIFNAHSDVIDIPAKLFEDQAVTVALLDTQIVDFSVVLQCDDGHVELDGLFVEPAYWRQGIGRLLIQRAVQRALKHGRSTLQAIANPHAHAFYQSLGFKQTGITQTQFGPGLLMQYQTRSHLIESRNKTAVCMTHTAV